MAARRSAKERCMPRGSVSVQLYSVRQQIAEDLEGALELLAPRLDDRVVLEVDTYWVEVGGVDVVDLLGRLGDRVRFLHVKDGDKSRDTKAQLPAGEGEMDIPAVLAAAPDAMRVLE